MGDKRGLIPDDFDDQQVEIIEKLVPSIENPILQALLSDVAWLRKRSRVLATTAISAYIRAADLFMEGHKKVDHTLAVVALQLIKRAVRLSLFAFKNKECPPEPVDALIEISSTLSKTGEFGQILSAKELIHSLKIADIEKRYEFIDNVARSSEVNSNPHMARELWLFCAVLLKQLKKKKPKWRPALRRHKLWLQLRNTLPLANNRVICMLPHTYRMR